MINHLLIYTLYNIKGLGRTKINTILSQLWQVSVRDKVDINSLIKEYVKKKYSDYSITEHNFNLNKVSSKFHKDIYFIDFTHQLYPSSLNILSTGKPTILSCIGNLELLSFKKIGFCGSRKATEKGHDIAKDISEQVVRREISVVSGYASGIDIETHYTALKNGGTTIIVLPEGIANFNIKTKLREVWDWDRVLVISEFEPNAIWSVSRAMERNSTIVSLSNVMILIEARIKGGSIDAGFKTLHFNKALFAPVYNGMEEEASGNHHLLTKGAFPLRKSKTTNKANLDRLFDILDRHEGFNQTLF